MTVGRHFHRPRIGDKFWDKNVHIDENGQPNGKIRWVDWSNKEVIVQFYDSSVRTYDAEDLFDCWEAEMFGGSYILYPKITKAERLKLAGKA